MKRKQKYRVSILHRATIDAVVIASNREDAKKKALERFYGCDSSLDSDFTNLPATIHKVVCMGTAESTKERKK